jgi:hypothetical protein
MSRLLFPTYSEIWHGAILSTIKHAIDIISYPMMSNELSWDGKNYNRQDSAGSRGTITFADNQLVAVFRDDNSLRTPWNNPNYNIDELLKGIPSDLLILAENEALQYVIDEYNGVNAPIITSAFWSNNEYMTSSESWMTVVEHGAHILSFELMNLDEAINLCLREYNWNQVEVNVLRNLFEKRKLSSSVEVTLTDDDARVFTKDGIDNAQESLQLLECVGIVINF